MFLMRLRTPGLERVEQALIRLFSFERGNTRGVTESWGKREILGSLAVYIISVVDGGTTCVLAYDREGLPIFFTGWRRGSLEEVEKALWMTEQGLNAAMSPLAFATHPALLNPQWQGWGPVQAAGCLSFYGFAGSSL